MISSGLERSVLVAVLMREKRIGAIVY